MTKTLLAGFFLIATTFAAQSAVITPDDVTIISISGAVGTFDKEGVSGFVRGDCGQATDITYTVTDEACGVIKPSPLVFGVAIFGQDPTIDGVGDGDKEDSLLFVFDNMVDFVSANLSLGQLASYDLYIDDILVFDDETSDPLDLTGNSGTSLRLVADSNLAFFYLNTLTVVPSQAVPLPGTVWLLVTGLVGLVGLPRLRKRWNEVQADYALPAITNP